jgi:hypothetical protein
MAGVTVDIRTRHLSNMIQERYNYTILLGEMLTVAQLSVYLTRSFITVFTYVYYSTLVLSSGLCDIS